MYTASCPKLIASHVCVTKDRTELLSK
eukprot:COSAG02_NODE_68289_length_251_cov_0.565789_1_plen_26_part_01